MKRGCLRPLLAAVAALLVLGAVLVVWHWPTFSLMFANMRTMSEGADAARAIRMPDDLLAYLAAHPEDVSLVAYDVGHREGGIFYQAEVRRPLASIPSLLVLAEYARQVEQGLVAPDERVPLEEVARYRLPGVHPGTPQQAGQTAEENGGPGQQLTIRQVVQCMMRGDSKACEDWLIDRFGRARMEALPVRLKLAHSDPPLPSSGIFLSWSNSAMTATPAERLEAYRTMARPAYTARVYELAHRLSRDSTFRRRETKRLTQRGTELSLRHQRSLAQTTYPRGTAADYASLLARMVTDSLLSAGVSRRMRGFIETAADTLLPEIETIGSEGGAFPGILSFAGYVERKNASQKRVVVLLMENLPMGVFYHLMQTGLDKGFQLQLLLSDAFFEQVRRQLSTKRAVATPR